MCHHPPVQCVTTHLYNVSPPTCTMCHHPAVQCVTTHMYNVSPHTPNNVTTHLYNVSPPIYTICYHPPVQCVTTHMHNASPPTNDIYNVSPPTCRVCCKPSHSPSCHTRRVSPLCVHGCVFWGCRTWGTPCHRPAPCTRMCTRLQIVLVYTKHSSNLQAKFITINVLVNMYP